MCAGQGALFACCSSTFAQHTFVGMWHVACGIWQVLVKVAVLPMCGLQSLLPCRATGQVQGVSGLLWETLVCGVRCTWLEWVGSRCCRDVTVCLTVAVAIIRCRYYRRNGECLKCPDLAWMLILFFLVGALSAVGLGYVLSKKQIHLAFLSIGVDYFQVSARAGSVVSALSSCVQYMQARGLDMLL